MCQVLFVLLLSLVEPSPGLSEYSMQFKTGNFFGIVMQINSKGKYEDHEFYKLTEKGMTAVKKCLADSNIEHIQQEHSSCKSKNLSTKQTDPSRDVF